MEIKCTCPRRSLGHRPGCPQGDQEIVAQLAHLGAKKAQRGAERLLPSKVLRRRGSLQTQVHTVMRRAFAEGCTRSDLIDVLAQEIKFVVNNELQHFARLRADNACKCGSSPTPLHPCPHAEELHDDSQPTCNCCETCTQACADDV